MEVYSVRSELDGSDSLALALGEGWEPFAAVPYDLIDQWGNIERTVLIYLRFRSIV